jgi:hypothetical protein
MKLTKQCIIECEKLVSEFGYWSDEVKNYMSNFPYKTATKLSNMMIQFEKGVN